MFRDRSGALADEVALRRTNRRRIFKHLSKAAGAAETRSGLETVIGGSTPSRNCACGTGAGRAVTNNGG